MSLLATILAALAAGAIAPLLVRRVPRRAGWILALIPAAVTAWLFLQVPSVVDAGPLRETVSWVPGLGLDVQLSLDGLGMLFALLISGIGTLVVVYAGGYLSGDRRLGRFYLILFGFMASMLGVALADNVILLYVFWALTGLTSYLLIGFDSHSATARRAALQALLTTFAGELALLAGVLMLARAGGSFQISELVERGDRIAADPLFAPMMVLLVAGALTKSAQFPFHYWLPNAMEAPTPVSAYLHSATMVKAGVYLLARFSPIFAGTDLWLWLVGGSGAITMVLGGVLALHQTDLKRLLAYSTVSALGIMTFLLGLGTEYAVNAAVVFLIGHALYKGTLFLVAGILDHETGMRDASRLSGLRRAMPLTTVAAVLAAFSMAGLLPFFGFIGKELVYEATLDAVDLAPALLTAAVLLPNVAFVVVAIVAGVRPFAGPRVDLPKVAHDPGPSMLAGPLLLGGLGVITGLVPAAFASGLASRAVASITGTPSDLELALWHGITPMLLLSGVTLLLGIVAFWRLRAVARLARRADVGTRIGPERAYEAGLEGIQRGAELLAGALQSGYLRRYLLIILTVGISLVGYAFLARGPLPPITVPFDAQPHEVTVVVIIVAAAMVAITTRSRLSAIAALGIVGYGVALIYMLFGAPDLAMTQILIETLTVILFVLVLYHLPRFAILSSARTRLRDATIAGVAGLLMTGLTLVAFSAVNQVPLSEFFAERSVPDAHGRNIVNVILVDFRALDTLGEITVLALAALGIYALLRLRPRKT
ncbi:MAG TPA: putative monovalent cation/H+ antiporter subunit A [Candidatus Angelobacter sp.]|nr:putative monovalent cation/H+ antiporter subunit A [Candidatus Angelobacter sp.]